VGHFAIQFAKTRGARVIATCASQDLSFVSRLGADLVVDYKNQRFEDVAKDVASYSILSAGKPENAHGRY